MPCSGGRRSSNIRSQDVQFDATRHLATRLEFRKPFGGHQHNRVVTLPQRHPFHLRVQRKAFFNRTDIFPRYLPPKQFPLYGFFISNQRSCDGNSLRVIEWPPPEFRFRETGRQELPTLAVSIRVNRRHVPPLFSIYVGDDFFVSRFRCVGLCFHGADFTTGRRAGGLRSRGDWPLLRVLALQLLCFLHFVYVVNAVYVVCARCIYAL